MKDVGERIGNLPALGQPGLQLKVDRRAAAVPRRSARRCAPTGHRFRCAGSRLSGELSMSMTAVSGRASGARIRRAAGTARARQSKRRPSSRKLRIAHLAQNDFASGSGGPGNVGRSPMPALVGEHREGDGLLRLRGHSRRVGRRQPRCRDLRLRCEASPSGQVARASAGDEQVVVSVFFGQPADGLADGARRQSRGRRQHVVPVGAAAALENWLTYSRPNCSRARRCAAPACAGSCGRTAPSSLRPAPLPAPFLWRLCWTKR